MPALFVPDVPTCGPRVKPEAMEYQQRNRGSMSNFLDHSKNKNYSSPRPMPRTAGNPETQEQMEKHRGSMNLLLNQNVNKNYSSPRPRPRCTSDEAKEQYERSRGSMSEMMTGVGAKVRGPVQARGVMPEASDNANKNKGLYTKKIFETYGQVTERPPPATRVKPEAADIANNSKGNATKALFHSYGRASDPPPKASLGVTEEAQEMANLDRGTRAKKLLSMDAPTSR